MEALAGTLSSSSIENLTLGEIMARNPHVEELYREHYSTIDKIGDMSGLVIQLLSDKDRLLSKIESCNCS
jgi:hypothetical protein